MRPGHLVRRALTSLPNRPVGAHGKRAARAVLLDAEFELWSSMEPRDQRHSLQVLSRFDATVPGASRPERAAALLHDVGKQVAGLGTLGRVLATVVGPHGARFRDYHAHERLGAELLLAAGSDEVTIRTLGGWSSMPSETAVKVDRNASA